MMFAGIDNGISGAIVFLSPDGLVVAWAPMPIQRARKGNEVDVLSLLDIIVTATGDKARDCIYTIEEPGGSKSAKAASSMAGSFHAIRSLLTLQRVRWDRVTPQQWQRAMLPGCKAGDSKPRALEAAGRLWPNETWFRTDKCKKAHDGGIDAALIAEWTRRNAVQNWKDGDAIG